MVWNFVLDWQGGGQGGLRADLYPIIVAYFLMRQFKGSIYKVHGNSSDQAAVGDMTVKFDFGGMRNEE